MSPIIHAELGWLLAQPLRRRRDRILVTLLAVAPDLDGLGLLWGEAQYLTWHHRLTHGVAAASLVTLAGGLLGRSWRVALLALLAFHLHLAADLVGSGPGWPIFYLWPWSEVGWLPSWQWDLASWQNAVIGMGVTFVALGCACWSGRTPVELVSSAWDARVVATVRARLGHACGRQSPM